MNYRFINGKYVIQKDGVYFAVTPNQVDDLQKILDNIKRDINSRAGDDEKENKESKNCQKG